jgi:hypothetical protein
MRYFILLTALCVLICCKRKEDKPVGAASPKEHQIDTTKSHEESGYIFDDLNSNTILTRLFDNPVFDSNGMAVWEPDFYDGMKFNVSEDGKCHTNVDTILYFNDHSNRKCAAAVLATYHYGRDISDNSFAIGSCHFCGTEIGIALFSQQEDKNWQLYRFEKVFTSLGYFGEYKTHRQDSGVISLKEIGDNWTVLSLRQGLGTGMGETRGYEEWYSLEQNQITANLYQGLLPIFWYTYYYSYDSNANNHPQIVETARVNFTKKNKGDYYGVDLISTKNGKQNTNHYVFSQDTGAYVKQRDMSVSEFLSRLISRTIFPSLASRSCKKEKRSPVRG